MNNSDDFGSIGDEGMVLLHKFPSVRAVLLHKNSITKKGVEVLSKGKFPYISRLDLGTTVDNEAFNKIGDEGIVFLHKFPTLKRIGLRNTNITGKGVQTLSEGNFPSL